MEFNEYLDNVSFSVVIMQVKLMDNISDLFMGTVLNGGFEHTNT